MSGKAIDPFPIVLSALVLVGLLVAFGASVLLPPQSAATAGDNGKTITVNQGSTIKVSLDENPSTGYSWNITTTPGLAIVDGKYVSGGSGLPGAGGIHEWTIKAEGKGQQQFSAVYKRPWMPIAGDETTYTLKISVT